MSIKFFCDICGKHIDGIVYKLDVNPVDVVSIYVNKHLCKNCVERLEGSLKLITITNKEAENDKSN